MTSPSLTEQEIQRAVFDHFAWRGAPDAFVCHYPAGGFRRPVEAAILKSIGTVAGVPDIIAIYRGRVFALELKTETGRVTDVQRAVYDRMRRAGAEVGVAYGLDEALAILEGWDLLRGRSQISRGGPGGGTQVLQTTRRARGSIPLRSTNSPASSYRTPPKASQLGGSP